MNWLQQEFNRARKRSAQIPTTTEPTGAVPCPICNEFAATLDMDARQLIGDVAFIHRKCLREMANRIEVLDREFAGWETNS